MTVHIIAIKDGFKLSITNGIITLTEDITILDAITFVNYITSSIEIEKVQKENDKNG